MVSSNTQVVWWVYMVSTQSGRIYTGITTDLERRFIEHSAVAAGGKKGAKFFRADQAVALVYRECVETRSEASRREAAIKKMPRQTKLDLIAAQQPILGD